MFKSMLDHKDLIFQDSSVRLVKVEEDRQNYAEYLGSSFMRAMQRMQEIDCVGSLSAGASPSYHQTGFLSVLLTVLLLVFIS